jgi:hypothetical protein
MRNIDVKNIKIVPEDEQPAVIDAWERERTSDNPLLEIFSRLRPCYQKGCWDFGVDLDFARKLTAITFRHHLCMRYAWAVPDEELLGALVKVAPLVEMGAGTGYWAKLLRARGADVVAFDYAPPTGTSERNAWHIRQATHSEVLQGVPADLALYSDRTLFLCWPPYADPMASDSLRHYRGNTVAYIGEGRDGCTGDDAFHETLERDFEEIASLLVPRWEGLRDHLWIYRRKAR